MLARILGGLTMRVLGRAAAACLILLAFGAVAPHASGQSQPAATPNAPGPTAVAVVDWNFVVRTSLAHRSAREQFDQFRTAFETEVKTLESKLREADQELSRQRAVLTPEAFAEKRREYEKQFLENQRQVQGKGRKIEEVYYSAIQTIEETLFGLIEQMATERNIALVIRKDAVILHEVRMDITKQALEKLNATMPSVVVANPNQ